LDVVVQILNGIIAEPCIYEAGRFKGIPLRPKTASLMAENPAGPMLVYLNRFLLEDAYTRELPRAVGPLACGPSPTPATSSPPLPYCRP